ncbi:MAG: cytochrome c biogenesis heme-transporting ATPase CcmA [Candidatus Methanofishera endochildressiae]|uniref:Cytochrome c biogenesis heme-transporting ATPase CcmA n=1 Tax=Candidatus Methanofishera endochildressiae TaxID=2738884 RepID=A0A7Z0MN65_9GAMM|nr:cytochrome c biogenesis heme-transporting ATPase CcmA [Candidatus Methanofishera endochildressiae]
MLEVKNLFCERDERVLFANFSFQINTAEVVQIIGQNGSGKTTLLRILCGLSDAYSGEIYWQGTDLDEVRDQYYQAMLYVGHLAGVKGSLTAEENLCWMMQLDKSLDKCTIATALKQVGLYGFENVPCHSLSAGQQRRVGLARLYLSSAPLWILDEPFTALDKKGVKEKEALIANHIQEGGSVILTTHHDLMIPGQTIRPINLDEVAVA